MERSEWLTFREAADLCAVDARTLRRWAAEDGLSLGRREGRVALHWRDLHKSLQRRKLPVPPGLDSGPKLLLVDDDPDQLLLMVDSLEGVRSRARIATARDAKGAREKLLRLHPDLLVLDLGLPDASGLELCRWARGERDLARLKVLAVTGHHDPARNREALASGADEYLTKPFVPEELAASAERLLGLTEKRGGWSWMGESREAL